MKKKERAAPSPFIGERKLGLSKYAAEAAEQAGEHPNKLLIAGKDERCGKRSFNAVA